jgi:hypothetical protein
MRCPVAETDTVWSKTVIKILPLHALLHHECSLSFSSISSRSSALSISMILFTSDVFRISSFAPAYNIFTSLLHVMGR